MDTTNDKELKCDHCLKLFQTEHKLKNHTIKVHSKVNHVPCWECSTKQPSVGDLRRHMVQTHKKGETYCWYCGTECHEASNIQAHLANHHARYYPFKCKLCGKFLGTETAMCMHLSRVHNQAEPNLIETNNDIIQMKNKKAEKVPVEKTAQEASKATLKKRGRPKLGLNKTIGSENGLNNTKASSPETTVMNKDPTLDSNKTNGLKTKGQKRGRSKLLGLNKTIGSENCLINDKASAPGTTVMMKDPTLNSNKTNGLKHSLADPKTSSKQRSPDFIIDKWNRIIVKNGLVKSKAPKTTGKKRGRPKVAKLVRKNLRKSHQMPNPQEQNHETQTEKTSSPNEFGPKSVFLTCPLCPKEYADLATHLNKKHNVPQFFAQKTQAHYYFAKKSKPVENAEMENNQITTNNCDASRKLESQTEQGKVEPIVSKVQKPKAQKRKRKKQKENKNVMNKKSGMISKRKVKFQDKEVESQPIVEKMAKSRPLLELGQKENATVQNVKMVSQKRKREAKTDLERKSKKKCVKPMEGDFVSIAHEDIEKYAIESPTKVADNEDEKVVVFENEEICVLASADLALDLAGPTLELFEEIVTDEIDCRFIPNVPELPSNKACSIQPCSVKLKRITSKSPVTLSEPKPVESAVKKLNFNFETIESGTETNIHNNNSHPISESGQKSFHDSSQEQKLVSESPNETKQFQPQFSCDLCPLVFQQSQHLSNHMKFIHRTADNYDCRKCSVSFKSAWLLVKHYKQIHQY